MSRDEQEALLREWTEGPAWRQVARPALNARLESLARQLLGGEFTELAQVQALQAEARTVRRILEDPTAFFLPPG